MVYGRKYHTVGPRTSPRSGSVSGCTSVTEFRYPENGGFRAYLISLRRGIDVRLGHGLVGLDPIGRVLRLAGGREVSADAVISSIPLPELVPLIDGVPDAVRGAAEALSFSSVMVVNIGVDREDLSPATSRTTTTKDIVFPRLNFPHMLSPHVVPTGAGLIQAEVYHSDRYRPLAMTPDETVDRVVSDLRRCGVLRDDDRLLVAEARNIRYANVIWDHQRAAAVETVHGYLNEIGVVRCGRYGDWDHPWTDEAFLSGERAGREVLASARLGAAAGAVAG